MNEMGSIPVPVLTDEKLCTPAEIASLLQVSIKTIYYWVMRNEIPYLKIGRHLCFKKESVIEYFQLKTQASKPACFQSVGPLLSTPSKRRSLKIDRNDRLGVHRKE